MSRPTFASAFMNDRIGRAGLLIGSLLVAACGQHDEDEKLAEASLAAAATPPDGGTQEQDWDGARWTGSVVPYVIDQNNELDSGCDNNGSMSDDQVGGLTEAIDQYEALTPLDFQLHPVDSPPASGPFIVFINSGSPPGHSKVRGMPLDGSISCVYIGTAGDDGDLDTTSAGNALHEIGHALGLAHEQQRSDRDSYVKLDHTCVDPGNPENLPNVPDDILDEPKIYGIDTDGLLLTPYDFDSILQYKSVAHCNCNLDDCDDGSGACGEDGKGGCKHPPMLKLDDTRITPPGELSVHDVNALNRMYERPLGVDNPNDQLGTALAVGDFDHDGYSDLAVGAPSNGNGAVFLWKGTGGAAPGSLGRLVAWTVLKPSVGFASRFGESLAAGDFNHDGHTDLAVGAPGEGGVYSHGSVWIYSSTPADGETPRRILHSLYVQVVTQATQGLGFGEAGDHFGAALAAADFNGDGMDDDLAIGVPQKLVGTKRSGEVVVIFGDSPTQAVVLTPEMVPGATNIKGARFGHALAAMNLDPEGAAARADLVVGSPENASPAGSGAVYLFAGAGNFFTPKQVLRPPGSPAGMHFGAAIAIGDFDGATTTPSGYPRLDLAVGAPHATAGGGTKQNAGAVFLFVPTSDTVVSYDPIPAMRVHESNPHAGDQFGGVLMAWHPVAVGDSTNAQDFLFAGLPSRNRVDWYSWAALDAADQLSSSLVGPSGLHSGDLFGAALAKGSFRPVANGSETAPYQVSEDGLPDVVVGEPGDNNGAGAFQLDNFGQSDAGLAWQRFSQTTAHSE